MPEGFPGWFRDVEGAAAADPELAWQESELLRGRYEEWRAVVAGERSLKS